MTRTDTIARPATDPTASETRRITKKGWFEDPRGEHRLRFHDGVKWTVHTTHYGPVPCLGCGSGAR